MEDFSFDISSGLLSQEEAEKLFNNTESPQEPEEPVEEEQKQTPTEEEETPSEKVGTEEIEHEENVSGVQSCEIRYRNRLR